MDHGRKLLAQDSSGERTRLNRRRYDNTTLNQFKRLSTAAFHSRIRVAQKCRVLRVVRSCVTVFHEPLHHQLGLGPMHQVPNRTKPQKTAQIPQPQRVHITSRHAIQEQ